MKVQGDLIVMLLYERRQAIIAMLSKNGSASVRDLADRLGVSTVTIRRDLNALEEDGLIVKTHGGAVILGHDTEPALKLSERERMYIEEKRRIGKTAAKLVQPGTTLIMDEGSTCLEIARQIKDIPNVTVITNGIRVAAELLGTNVNLVVIGGVCDQQNTVLYGPDTESAYKRIRADIYFMGIDAFSEKDGIMDGSYLQVTLKNLKANAVQRVIGVANGAKFGKRAMSLIGPITMLYALVTEEPISDELRICLNKHAIECIQA